LRQVGLEPDAVDPPAIDESLRRGELPREAAVRLAEAKARAVAPRHPGAVVVGADTLVVCGRRVLPKATEAAEARRCLELLSGRQHRVLGGLCVVDATGRAHARLVTTKVRFKRLAPCDVDAYLAAGEWRDKAGAYAIQGRAGAFVSHLNGSYSNVVGLPLFETVRLLGGLGVRPCRP
jgi:septum formation protein